MPPTSETLDFKTSNFNRVAATAGGFLSVFGLVSYLLKEKFYLGEAFVSLIAGIIFSPHATNLLRPLEYVRGNEETLESLTLYFTRLVLGVQLVLAGIQLPSRYLRKEWRSLAYLLGPGMCAMWISTGLLVWALVPNISFVQALAVGSCVTPTDPVLSASIVKGKFADKNIPKKLQRIIVAESGTNDGLGYPFLFLPLYLVRYAHDGGLGQSGGASKVMAYWFGITWGYEIIMSVLYGALVGYIYRIALRWAEDHKFVDRESFLVFAITIALFIVGTLGMLGSDDILACFIAGNVFTWDDWFRLKTEDDSFQPTIDMLLTVSIFAWYGAICPWYSFAHNNVIPIYRLIFLGVLVLILRRLPIVLAMHKRIHQIEEWRQAFFVGFFGPMGVSAIFYLYTSREFLRQTTYQGQERADAERLAEVFNVVVWFMVVCSVTVHGLSIPLAKLGIYLDRTISRAKSSDPDEPASFHVRDAVTRGRAHAAEILRVDTNNTGKEDAAGVLVPRKVSRIGGTTMRNINRCKEETSKAGGRRNEEQEEQDAQFVDGREEERAAEEGLNDGNRGVAPNEISTSVSGEEMPLGATGRRGDLTSPTSPATAETLTRGIRFGDEKLG